MARRRRRSDTVVRGPSVGTAVHNHACCSWGIYLDKEAAKGGMGSERGSNKRSLESLALLAATIHSCGQQTMQSCVTLDCGVVSCQTARAKLDPGSTFCKAPGITGDYHRLQPIVSARLNFSSTQSTPLKSDVYATDIMDRISNAQEKLHK
jgi:hypothetical protein